MLDPAEHGNPRGEELGLEQDGREVCDRRMTTTLGKTLEKTLRDHERHGDGLVFELSRFDARLAQEDLGRTAPLGDDERTEERLGNERAHGPGGVAEAVQSLTGARVRGSFVTKASIRGPGPVESIPSPLEGAIVQKVRLGVDRLALDLRAPGRSTWVELRTTPTGLRLRGGEGKSEPLAPCPDQTLVRYARKHLEGARFAAVSTSHVDFLTAAGLVRLSLQGKAGRFVPRFSACPFAEGLLPSEAELFERPAAATPSDAADPFARDRLDLLKAVDRERKRTERTLAAVRDDAAAIAKARDEAAKARFFVALAKHAAPGTDELVLGGDAAGAEPVRLRIDPRVAPQVALERIFARSKRLAAREGFVADRAGSLAEALETFEALRGQALAAPDRMALAELRETFRGLARRTSTTAATRAREGAQTRVPYKTFVGAGDREILVGRSSAKNHELTFRVAKGSDLWLHARDIEGAHVVVRLRRDEQPAPELLLDAAHLAVHFSRARDENLVDVQYTHVGHLKKLPTPGAVILTREKVLAVRVDRARTQALLATER